MRGTKLKLSVTLLLALGLGACTQQQQYRTKVDLCVSQTPIPSAECELHALQRYSQESNADQDYLLGFIEFDDQGLMFDRKQMEAVIDAIYKESITKDLLITVFMHGWQHNAAPGDDNIETFRTLLRHLTKLEGELSANNQESPRQVVGIYLGWRGRTITTPIIGNLSFWERQNTAHKIGETGVAEILRRLERIKLDKDSITARASHTRLAVIGNGMGGEAIYTALAQRFQSKFIQTIAPEGIQGDTVGFGNLTILINPNLSALQFSSLSDMAAARGSYFGSQLPVLAVLTSETDYATKMLFTFGRRLATLFDTEREITRWNATTRKNDVIDESALNVTALGHFMPYKTHYLHTSEEPPLTKGYEIINNFYKIYNSWVLDYPGSQIEFNGSILERTADSAGRNPYLVVQVNRDMIKNHDDIYNERLMEFVKELMMISNQTPKMIAKSKSELNVLGR